MKKIIKNVVCLAAGVCCISDVVGLPTGSYNNQYSFFQKGGNNSRFGNNNRGAINEPFINNDTSSIFANPAPFSRKNKQSGVVCQQIAGSIAEVGQLVKKSILSLDDIGEVGRLEELCQNTFAEVSRMLKVQKNKIQQQSVEADYESDEFDEDDDDSFSGGRAQQRYVPPYNLGGNVKKNTFGQVPMGMGMQGGLPSQNNGWGKLSNLNSVKKKNNMLSLLSQRQQKNPMGNGMSTIDNQLLKNKFIADSMFTPPQPRQQQAVSDKRKKIDIVSPVQLTTSQQPTVESTVVSQQPIITNAAQQQPVSADGGGGDNTQVGGTEAEPPQ